MRKAKDLLCPRKEESTRILNNNSGITCRRWNLKAPRRIKEMNLNFLSLHTQSRAALSLRPHTQPKVK